MNYTLKILFFIFLGFIFSCDPEENDTINPISCPPEIDLGDVMLIDSSLAIYPYKEQDSKVVFKDSLGNEISFDIEELSTRESSESFFGDCGPNQEIKYLYNLFYRYAELINDSLDLRLKFTMIPDPSPLLYSPSQWNDIVIIEVNQPINSSDKEVLRFTVNRRNNDPGAGVVSISPEFEQLITVNDIEFENVFWGIVEPTNEEIKIFCNRNQGIVSIQNISTGLILALDRIE